MARGVWEAIGAVASILALVLSIVLGWEKIAKLLASVRTRSTSRLEAVRNVITVVIRRAWRPILPILAIVSLGVWIRRNLLIHLLYPLSSWASWDYAFAIIQVVALASLFYLLMIEPWGRTGRAGKPRDSLVKRRVEVSTIVSGEVGEFSPTRDGPWTRPIACQPVHQLWRSIEGAKWVWIRERPTDLEAKQGVIVWHRFGFRLPQNYELSTARLSLMVDDYVRIFINGELVKTVTMNEDIVGLDVVANLHPGNNLVEMEIENQAYPESTGIGNPTGIIYRLEFHPPAAVAILSNRVAEEQVQ